MTELVTSAVGGRIVECNDEFFAEAANLLSSDPPVWKEGEYTDHGKWMDGWETRRRREAGHDWCVIGLGIPGQVEKVTIDTAFFTGNYPEEFSLEACGVGSDDLLEAAEWIELVSKSPLQGDSIAEFEVGNDHRVTHLRLNIFPDGGVARLRVEGAPVPSIHEVCPESGSVDLASLVVGGEALEASDAHYSPPSNMLRPTTPKGMWDGWETKRRRDSGHDWATFRLGMAGVVEEFVVDTRHFKGNSPGWVSVHVAGPDEVWHEVLTRAPVEADSVNRLPLDEPVEAVLVRLDIHPDGGVARFHVLGRAHSEAAADRRVDYLNALFDQPATYFFKAACSSSRWVEAMREFRPFNSVAEVLGAAERSFDLLEKADWLEAFAGHPRIGETGDPVANKEQSTMGEAEVETLEALADANARYEDEFGFTYIVFATGKNAVEMLSIANSRLGNSRDQEVANAAGEQRLITRTRLRRMLCQNGLE